jgi:hypothetical protein
MNKWTLLLLSILAASAMSAYMFTGKKAAADFPACGGEYRDQSCVDKCLKNCCNGCGFQESDRDSCKVNDGRCGIESSQDAINSCRLNCRTNNRCLRSRASCASVCKTGGYNDLRKSIRALLGDDAGTSILPSDFHKITDDRVEKRLGEFMLLIANKHPGHSGFADFRSELTKSWNGGFKTDLDNALIDGNCKPEARLLLFLVQSIVKGPHDDEVAYKSWQRIVAADHCQCKPQPGRERNPPPHKNGWWVILEERKAKAPLEGQRMAANYLFKLLERVLDGGDQIGACPPLP